MNPVPLHDPVELLKLKHVEWVRDGVDVLRAAFIELKLINPRTGDPWDFYFEFREDVTVDECRDVIKYIRNYPWTQDLLQNLTYPHPGKLPEDISAYLDKYKWVYHE